MIFGGSIWGGPQGGGTPKPCQNICFLSIYWYQKKLAPYVKPLKNWFLGVPFGQVLEGVGTPKLCQNICLLSVYWYWKKLAPYVEPLKKLIFGGVPRGGGGWQKHVKIFVSQTSTDIQKTGTLAWVVQKFDFLAPHFGGSPGELPQKSFWRHNCKCTSTTSHKN